MPPSLPAPLGAEVPFQALVEQSLVGIYVIQDGELKYTNAAFATMNGYQPEEMIGRRLTDLVAPSSVDQVLAHVAERLHRGGSLRYLTRGLHKEGYEIDIEVHGTAGEFEGRPAVVGVAVEVSERMHYERELQESRELLRLLAMHLTKVREEQRAAIATEIHDSLGGLLTTIKMEAARLRHRVSGEEQIAIADDLIATAQEGIDLTREISETLYPAVLQHLGLEAALRSHLEKFCGRSGLRYELVLTHVLPPLPAAHALAAFRIFQEALTNVVRHAGATRVTIRVEDCGDRLRLDVIDDGSSVSSETHRADLGILGMQERARALGGQLVFEHFPPGGSRLRLELPSVQQEAR